MPIEVNKTVPVKPLTGATVIVEVAKEPVRMVIEVELAATVRSVTVTAAVDERDTVPMVPVTFMVKVAVVEQLTVSVDIPDVPSVTLVGLSVTVQLGGAAVTVSETTPAKPFRAAAVMVTSAVDPDGKLTDVGLTLMVKSVTVTMTVAMWERLPLVPFIVTV